MLKSEIKKKNMSLKKIKKCNLSEPHKPELIFKTLNSWNSRPKLNQEAQFQTNLILNDETDKEKSI
jgi:hypothetical protein